MQVFVQCEELHTLDVEGLETIGDVKVCLSLQQIVYVIMYIVMYSNKHCLSTLMNLIWFQKHAAM